MSKWLHRRLPLSRCFFVSVQASANVRLPKTDGLQVLSANGGPLHQKQARLISDRSQNLKRLRRAAASFSLLAFEILEELEPKATVFLEQLLNAYT